MNIQGTTALILFKIIKIESDTKNIMDQHKFIKKNIMTKW